MKGHSWGTFFETINSRMNPAAMKNMAVRKIFVLRTKMLKGINS